MRAVMIAIAVLVCTMSPTVARAVDRSLGAHLAPPSIGGDAWSPAAKARLGGDLDAILAGASTLRGAHVGLLAVDSRSGDLVYAHNADDAFVPASTMKLLTGSVAVATLGPGYRFVTEAALNPTKNMLVIRAAGDPLLAYSDLASLGQAVRAAGIRKLAGGIAIDASALASSAYPPGWSWDDFAYDYAPVLSAAAIEENVVHLMVRPGATVSARLQVEVTPIAFPVIAPSASSEIAPIASCTVTHAIVIVPRANTTAVGTAPALDISRDSDGCIDVVGSLPLGSNGQSIDAAVPNPIWYMRALAQAALRTAGIDVESPLDVIGDPLHAPAGAELAPTDMRVVWTHTGEPLSDLLADMWWPSDNFVAEALLEAVGVQRSGMPGTLEHGIAAEVAWLTKIGIDPASVTIADGSGLSTYDRLTPRALTAILQADWNGPNRAAVLDDLPVAGVRGTLEHSFAGSLAERRTFAKTGSVMHARGLAGYLATMHHGALTFAWSVDDWMGNDDDLAALRARVLSRIIGDENTRLETAQ